MTEEYTRKKSYLIDAAAGVGLNMTETQAEKLLSYCGLLTEWNHKINLTAITEFEEIVEKHFLDSLAPLWCEEPVLSGAAPLRILDVGSGAGFPGIPIAVMCPRAEVTLLDSLNKRSDFQKLVKSGTGLDNLTVVNARAEDAARSSAHREHYDVVVSRAVADLAVLAEYCLPFTAIGGRFISFKGDNVSEEAAGAGNAVDMLGGSLSRTGGYMLPRSGQRRSLLVIQKDRPTPEKYPRRAGIPSKRPLK